MLTWCLHVAPNFILKIFTELLYFFSKIWFQNFMTEYFSNVSSKIYSFKFFDSFTNFGTWFLFSDKNFIQIFLYLNIIVQVNLL